VTEIDGVDDCEGVTVAEGVIVTEIDGVDDWDVVVEVEGVKD